jgi:LPXTG-site transpeptidase (sortase) family protein
LKKWIVHYPWTANPWENWNLFLTGHSSYYPWDNWKYKDIFSRLWELEVWDVYFVFKNQKKHTYKILEKKEINPKNISVLNQPKNKKFSTLMTCTPVWTTLRRLIIKSEEI